MPLTVGAVNTPPAPSRRDRQRAERRARLVRAALSAFDEQGFSQTTVDHITSRADLGHGTFYQYFASKDELLLALMEGTHGPMAECLVRPMTLDADAEECLRASALALLAWFREHRIVLLALRQALEQDRSFWRAWEPLQRALERWAVDVIAWGRERGVYRGPEPSIAAAHTVRLMIATAYDFALGEQQTIQPPAEQLAAATATFCANALFER